MEELAVREVPTDVIEESKQLVVVERAPRRERHLERAEAGLVGDPQPLDQDRGREADRADHRPDPGSAQGLVGEGPDDLAVAARVDRVALAARAEHVDVGEAERERAPDLLSEQLLDQLLALVPRDGAGDEDRLRIARHAVSRTPG